MLSIEKLKVRLDNAERAFVLAQYIADANKMIRERNHFESVIKQLKERIERRTADLKELL